MLRHTPPLRTSSPHQNTPRTCRRCDRRAGWVKWREKRGMVYLRCPRTQIERALAGVA
jgi:hypothetical protein